MDDLNTSMQVFHEFLVASWGSVAPLFLADKTGSLKDDWLQANWELLVESIFVENGYTLEVYGDGADANSPSSRILYPDRLPTRKVIMQSKENTPVIDLLSFEPTDFSKTEVGFDRFETFSNGWWSEKLPFSHVLGGHRGREFVFPVENIAFNLTSIQ